MAERKFPATVHVYFENINSESYQTFLVYCDRLECRYDVEMGKSIDVKRSRRVGRGLSPPASHRSERDALASLGSHQANTPVIPSRQCTKRCALCPDNFCRNWLARILWALKRLNFRSAQASSV